MTPFESHQGIGQSDVRTDTNPVVPPAQDEPRARRRVWRYVLVVPVLLALAVAAGWVTGFFDRFDLFGEQANGVVKQPATDALAVSLSPDGSTRSACRSRCAKPWASRNPPLPGSPSGESRW